MRDPGVAITGRGARRDRRRRGSRRGVILGIVSVVVLALAAGGAGDPLPGPPGSPPPTAGPFPQAWENGGDPAHGEAHGGGRPPPRQQAAAQLGMRHIHLVLGRVTPAGGPASARFTATADLASGHVWTYQGQLALVKRGRHWWVNWSPAAIYPGLRAGQ